MSVIAFPPPKRPPPPPAPVTLWMTPAWSKGIRMVALAGFSLVVPVGCYPVG